MAHFHNRHTLNILRANLLSIRPRRYSPTRPPTALNAAPHPTKSRTTPSINASIARRLAISARTVEPRESQQPATSRGTDWASRRFVGPTGTREAGAPKQHIFTKVIIFIGANMPHARAIIDSGSTWNLISQITVRENAIPGDDNLPAGLKTLGGNSLRIYQHHRIPISVQDYYNIESLLHHDIFGADMQNCEMILGLPWLRKVNPGVNWKEDIFAFRAGGEASFDM